MVSLMLTPNVTPNPAPAPPLPIVCLNSRNSILGSLLNNTVRNIINEHFEQEIVNLGVSMVVMLTVWKCV